MDTIAQARISRLIARLDRARRDLALQENRMRVSQVIHRKPDYDVILQIREIHHGDDGLVVVCS